MGSTISDQIYDRSPLKINKEKEFEYFIRTTGTFEYLNIFTTHPG